MAEKVAGEPVSVWSIGALLLLPLFTIGGVARAQHVNDGGAPCRNKVVTEEVYSCFDMARKTADKQLNQTYNDILAKLSPEEQGALLMPNFYGCNSAIQPVPLNVHCTKADRGLVLHTSHALKKKRVCAEMN
jgi:hypothetical protein